MADVTADLVLTVKAKLPISHNMGCLLEMTIKADIGRRR
jgi:hypothetical protein